MGHNAARAPRRSRMPLFVAIPFSWPLVVPAQAGTQRLCQSLDKSLDSRLRGNDGGVEPSFHRIMLCP
ncbi:protein of unknown function [Cupriavidus taiwanensis]|nr:conserved exported hypothetical protein [Cupriavidus taiwanensis]SPD38784.1 protein of unknown function [Cupriavidus taiwanensis]